MKKYLSAFVFILVFFLLPLCAQAAEQNQIKDVGGVTFLGGDASKYEQDISVSKTISRAENDPENFFDITLDVTTTTRRPPVLSTDVVIVMDISNTMNTEIPSNKDKQPSRLDVTKDSAKAIVDYFQSMSALTPVNLSLVAFNTDATTVFGLSELSTTAQATTLKNIIDGYTLPEQYDDSHKRFTNIEAGLRLARNILTSSASTSAYKYVILITDGFPTTYIASSKESTTEITGFDPYMNADGAPSSGEEGYFKNTLDNLVCTYGTSYSDKAAKKARTEAAFIKQQGINIFTIGVDIGKQSVAKYLESNTKSYSIVDTVGMSANDEYYEIGEKVGVASDKVDKNAYKTWLGNKIGGGPHLSSDVRYFDAPSQENLEEAISVILKQIERAPLLDFSTLTLNDPMNPYIEFLYFYDKSGNAVLPTTEDAAGTITAELVGSHTDMAETVNPEQDAEKIKENTASFSRTDYESSFSWNLLQSAYTESIDAGKNILLNYQLKYRVRLRNEIVGYENSPGFSTSVLTNNETTVTWRFIDSEGNLQGNELTQQLTKIPQVEGYKGELSFHKTSSGGQDPLAGAQFTLTHTGSACPICSNKAEFYAPSVGSKYVATSNENGIVSFDNIPSGHTYILTETYTPSGKVQVHDHLVTVSYGTTSVRFDTDGDLVSKDRVIEDGFFTDTDDGLILPNGTPIPVRLRLKLDKLLEGRTLQNGEFSFRLSGAAAHNATISQTVACAADGSIIFDPLLFDTASTGNGFVYTITELVDTDSSAQIDTSDETVVYDGTTYTIHVKVYQAENGAGEWSAQVSFDGGISYSGPYTGAKENGKIKVYDIDVPHPDRTANFVNTLREPTFAELTAQKTISNFALSKEEMKGKFAYELFDAQTQSSTIVLCDENGLVSFPKLSYTSSGKYRYVIREFESHSSAPYDQDFAYDSSVWDVTVNVTRPQDLTSSDPFTAYVSYVKRGTNTAADTATFTNHVKSPASLTVRGLKLLDDKPAVKGEWMFELVEIADGRETVLETVASDANGVITFSPIRYEASPENAVHSPVGSYQYIVREVIPSEDKTDKSIIYDLTVYNIFVSVFDNGSAYDLLVNVTGVSDMGESIPSASTSGTNVILDLKETEYSKPIIFNNYRIVIPETGDSKNILPWLLALVISSAALLLSRKKRTSSHGL